MPAFPGADIARVSLKWSLFEMGPLLPSPLAAIRRGHDVVFLPNFAIFRPAVRPPLVMTLHDATPLLHSGFFGSGERRWHAMVRPRRLLRGSHRILANSHQSANEAERIGAAPDRVSVIHHGIGADYRPASSAAVSAVRGKYGLPDGPYFLYLGAVEPRKNVAALVRGFNEARRSGLEASLVIAGPVKDAEQLADCGDGTSVLGYIDAEDKGPLYTGAHAAVSLAHHEGFGMLPLEAAAAGTSTILRRLPIYAETIGTHATYVDADDPRTVARALADQLAAPRRIGASEQAELRDRFSWDRCAALTLDVLRDAAGLHGDRP